MKWKRLTPLWSDKDYDKFSRAFAEREARRLKRWLKFSMAGAPPEPDTHRSQVAVESASLDTESSRKVKSAGGLREGQIITFNSYWRSTIVSIPRGYAVKFRILRGIYYYGGLSTAGYIRRYGGSHSDVLWYAIVDNDLDPFQGYRYLGHSSYSTAATALPHKLELNEEGKPYWFVGYDGGDSRPTPFERVVASHSDEGRVYVDVYRCRGAIQVKAIYKLEV